MAEFSDASYDEYVGLDLTGLDLVDVLADDAAIEALRGDGVVATDDPVLHSLSGLGRACAMDLPETAPAPVSPRSHRVRAGLRVAAAAVTALAVVTGTGVAAARSDQPFEPIRDLFQWGLTIGERLGSPSAEVDRGAAHPSRGGTALTDLSDEPRTVVTDAEQSTSSPDRSEVRTHRDHAGRPDLRHQPSKPEQERPEAEPARPKAEHAADESTPPAEQGEKAAEDRRPAEEGEEAPPEDEEAAPMFAQEDDEPTPENTEEVDPESSDPEAPADPEDETPEDPDGQTADEQPEPASPSPFVEVAPR